MKIGILTRLPNYYTERRLQEEAEKRGHTVIMLRSSACHIEIDGGNPKVIYKGEILEPLDAVIPRIALSNVSYGSAILRQFETMGVYTPAKSLAIGRSHDILRTLQLLSKEGIGIPKTIITHEPDQLDNLLERLGLPVVIKAASARNNGAVLVESPKAANSVLKAFYMNDSDLLLQEYVGKGGEEAQDVRAIVVGSMVVASVKRNGSAQKFFSKSGKTEYDLVAKLSEEEMRVAVKAAKAIGLSICAVDMMITAKKQFVLRIEALPGLENIELATNRNVAGKIIEYVERNAKQRNRKDKVGA
jgi:ribosomal protein S6--L-glutamate ligase